MIFPHFTSCVWCFLSVTRNPRGRRFTFPNLSPSRLEVGKGRDLSFAAPVIQLTQGINEEQIIAVEMGVTLRPSPGLAVRQSRPGLVQPAGFGGNPPHRLPAWLNDILYCGSRSRGKQARAEPAKVGPLYQLEPSSGSPTEAGDWSRVGHWLGAAGLPNGSIFCPRSTCF